MQINTKFSVGDSVVFLHRNCFTRRTISRIEITASSQGIKDTEPSVLITYYFPDLESTNYDPNYKYENEIAATKEELAKMAPER